jgi:hypothetical protein
VEYQTPDAPVCIQDRHRIVWIDSEFQAESTENVVSVDEDVSESYGGGEADDTYPAMLSLAQTLCQGWDGLVSELASNQIQSSVRTYGVADHVTHHRHSRGLGVVDEVTQDVSDPPAAAP